MGRPKRRRTRERAIPRRRTGQTPGARGKAGSREAPGPERARRGERQNAEGERNHEGRKEAETHTEHGGGRKTRQKPPDVERPGAPAQHPATGTCRFGRDGGGDPRAFRTRSARPQARATFPSSTRPPYQFKRRQPLTDFWPVKGGVSRRRRSGPCPLTGPKGVCFFAGGLPGRGRGRPAQAKTRRQRRGWGPAACQGRQARRMGRTPKKPARPPQSCCGGTRAKRDASGPPRSLAGGHRADRHKCTPDQGLHAGAKPLPYLDTIETSLTKKSG